MELSEIILGPKITEKTVSQVPQGRFTILVNIKASKNQIRQALKKIYQVEAIKINLIKIKARKKETTTKIGKIFRKRRAYKKAVVVLKKGQKIPGFEMEK